MQRYSLRAVWKLRIWANNHSKDYGEQSYIDTIKALEDEGITTFGYDRTAVMEIKGVKVGLLGTMS